MLPSSPRPAASIPPARFVPPPLNAGAQPIPPRLGFGARPRLRRRRASAGPLRLVAWLLTRLRLLDAASPPQGSGRGGPYPPPRNGSQGEEKDQKKGKGVGRRREDEYLDGDDNQEDEPTHKGADAGHQNDDSSSCTTSHCGGYRFGSLHGRAECYYLDVRCLMYWMFVKLCIYELDV
ncbi:uncharacterized protein LOC119303789 isoform X4 [Triticum dicoccoides]|uniref:uncharacterized protein LOC119303789 isoform X4 n=1 Tax=Triticum dicoccoides TaxID=85692 RepID=UPI00188F11DF|nr:uncharacterized protein LOC119303789 isoform X4 [Triticum dicoccoides]